MILTPQESRVLGVLIEKAHTTPQQYPMTLNALVTGCNQKNNREPVVAYTEDDVLDAIDGLRSKGLLREVMLSGSRVAKFRHVLRDILSISTPEVVVLAELLLRGPSTVGELRGRASRMHELATIEVVEGVLASLMQRDPPAVRELAPTPGTRAVRYAQLLCPDLHPLDAAPPAPSGPSPRAAGAPARGDAALAERVAVLEREVAALRSAVEGLAAARTAS